MTDRYGPDRPDNPILLQLAEAQRRAAKYGHLVIAWETWLVGQGYQVQDETGEYLERPRYIGAEAKTKRGGQP